MTWSRIMWAISSPGDIETRAGAAEKALRLASAWGAELEIFHCVFDPGVARPGRFASRGVRRDIQEIVEQRHRQLEHNAERLRGRGVRVHTSVRWDYPAFEGVVRQVLRHRVDLLIAQSTSRGRAARLALTYGDFKLIETCPSALLLIKSSRPYSRPQILAAVDPLHTRAKPAALDDAIVEAAGRISTALSGKLQLLHACTPWEVVAARDPALRRISQAEQPDVQSAYYESVASRVRALAERIGVSGGRVRVLDGEAEECVPAFARSEHADILAMGAVSRSLLKRIVLGHTAERILDALDCDVLIVKPHGFVSPVTARSVHRVDRSVAQSGKYVF